ncbi:MAG TPA: hypothetical protein VHB54_07395 [Mucilaginibacter sp.]|nr:hypothetical protein [Mucilaginibacter sp.]
MEENNDKSPDWWDELSDSQKLHISEGLDDAANGRIMSSEDFWKRLKQGDSSIKQ